MNVPLRKTPTEVPGLPSVPQHRLARAEPEERAIRLRPDGPPEEIPVTREILLNPCPEIKILQSDDQSEGIRQLDERLRRFVERRPGWRLFSDVGIRWPMLSKNVSPDIAVAEDVSPRKPGKPRNLLDVAKEGCRVRAVFEVVSSKRLARRKDEEWNPPRFARAGVDDLVLVYLPNLRRAGDPPLRLFSLSGQSYRERGPGADGRYLVRSLGVSLAVEGEGVDEEVVAYDAATGERLPNVEEARAAAELRVTEGVDARAAAEEARAAAELRATREAEARAAAEEARAAAELQATREAEARAAAELQATQEAEARAAAELQATQEAEARQAMEAENQRLLAEVKRLRGQS